MVGKGMYGAYVLAMMATMAGIAASPPEPRRRERPRMHRTETVGGKEIVTYYEPEPQRGEKPRQGAREMARRRKQMEKMKCGG